jgi:hypothetical protein
MKESRHLLMLPSWREATYVRARGGLLPWILRYLMAYQYSISTVCSITYLTSSRGSENPRNSTRFVYVCARLVPFTPLCATFTELSVENYVVLISAFYGSLSGY